MANYNNSGLINDIVKDYIENKEPEVKEAFEVKAEPVRYKGGETEKDDEGKEFTAPVVSVGPISGGTSVIKAKPGEPEYGYEWAQDAAQRAYDTGETIDEVEKYLGKKWKLADAQIKNNEVKTHQDKYLNENAYVKYYDKEKDENGDYIYLTPTQQAEEAIGRKYAFRPKDEIFYPSDAGPSWASRVLKRTNLQDNWNKFIHGKNLDGVTYIDRPNDYDDARDWVRRSYLHLRKNLDNLDVVNDGKELKKLGVEGKDQLNMINAYLKKNLDALYVRMIDGLDKKYGKGKYEASISKTEAPKAEAPKAEAPKTEVKTETAEASSVPSDTEVKTEVTEDEANTEVPNTEAESEVEESEESEPTEEQTESYRAEEARLNQELAEQEEAAQKEAEEIAEREMTEQEAAELDKKLEEAARKRMQDQFDYEEWLKNPTIISGIFGKSGLSLARRIGLGLSTLFAIFSDVARNYGKGINNNTDFKNEAMAELYKTIGTIQDKRANAAGDMASGYFQATTENDKQLNAVVTKMKRLSTAKYIPDSAMRIFAQEAIVDTKSPLSDNLYEQVLEESRKGFIDRVKSNSKTKRAYLDSDGNLNEAGEAKFLEKQAVVFKDFQNVMSISPDRMKNINERLALERDIADTRKKVHDVNFQTNTDYTNAESAINAEITSLEASKLQYTELATLDAMLEYANNYRGLVAGLSTSNSSASDTETSNEATLQRFTEHKGLEEVNEELSKHGWQAELSGEVGAKFPFKIIPISAEIDGGVKWTSEQANKHLESKYNKFINDDQRSTSKARSLSNITGRNVDDFTRDIVNILQTEKAKGAEADFNKVRQQVIDSIDERIELLRRINNDIDDMRKRETRFDISNEAGTSTINPYVSMFNDVPSKNKDWYKYRLSLT